MNTLRVGIIGTGKKKERPDAMGYAMAYQHAIAYQKLDSCEIVACADLVEENARAFAETFDVSGIFTDYEVMLKEAQLDVVSICTWPHLHEPMTRAACAAGVKAIHCEKPMADTWGGARRMAETAQQAGVQLTFNHQRRYGAPFVMAKQLLDAGTIGDLVRQESECSNIYDMGTHSIDMFSLFNGERPAKWVLGQIDYRRENRFFGAHCENQAVVLTEYENGVFGMAMSGAGGAHPVGAFNRLIGTDGVIEVGAADGSPLRYRPAGEKEWAVPDTNGESIHGPGFIDRAIADVIGCLQQGEICQLDARHALIATEIIFGAYESSRRRGRVDFPLNIDDNPLASMVESGALQPVPAAG